MLDIERGKQRLVGVAVVSVLLAGAASTWASEMGRAATARVSEDSYRYFLDDMLYTHDGDDRGFGPEHDLAQDNIVDLMTDFGLTVTLEPFLYYGGTYYNVVGTKLGTMYPDEEYIIGAHYDSVNNPGADDNASGVALVLEAARILAPLDSERTIRFIAFDREEQGLYGSEAYVAAHSDDDILGMISADMVAFNFNNGDHVDLYGRTASQPHKVALGGAVAEYGQGLTYSLGGTMDASDHAPFEWEGFQACLLIEDWGNPYYHTQLDSVDTPDYIDYAYATKITRSVVGFLVDQANVTVALPDGDFDGDGDVDLDDYDSFVACFSGPGGGPLSPECFIGDFDVDGDVDCDDWDVFVLLWTEPDDPPAFATCAVPSPLPAPFPHDTVKNRYISFSPDQGDKSTAYQVELVASADFPDSTGTVGWVGEANADGIARLVDEPFFADDWLAVVHVGDCEIVPVATYEVRETFNGVFFSEPLSVSTIPAPDPGLWADCVGSYDEDEDSWSGPNGTVNFVDIHAVVMAFEVHAAAPQTTWVDVHDEVPNGIANFSDIFLIVLAFQGDPYPFADPIDCP